MNRLPDPNVVWQYVPPEHLRNTLAWLEVEAASLRLTLESVERGNVVLLGDGVGNTCRFTAPEPRDSPFT